MRATHVPFTLEGATVRLRQGPLWSLAQGPGHVGRGGVAGLAVWQAGAAIREMDLFADFWDFDAGQIDWLTGFLCDQTMVDWFARLANPPEEEEEPEELFARASMTTLESTVEDGR